MKDELEAAARGSTNLLVGVCNLHKESRIFELCIIKAALCIIKALQTDQVVQAFVLQVYGYLRCLRPAIRVGDEVVAAGSAKPLPRN
jgi:hypothetical protein